MEKLNNNSDFQKLQAKNVERLKELACNNHTTNIIKENKPISETLQRICHLLRAAWQYHDYTIARIILMVEDSTKYCSRYLSILYNIVLEQTTYFKHIRFKKPISIIMDGKKRLSIIQKS